MEKTVVDVLLEARDLIRDQGWATGHLVTTDSEGKKSFCVRGSLMKATGCLDKRWESTGNNEYITRNKAQLACRPAAECLEAALRNRNVSFTSISSWNDIHARGVQDVLDLFDEAIRLAKDGE